jgi:hypothetical protein
MKFKIGDRVRIVGRSHTYFGKEATIWAYCPDGNWSDAAIARGIRGPSYRLDVDGVGSRHAGDRKHIFIAAMPEDIEPIIPLGSWDEITQMLGKDIREPVPA